MSQIILTFCIIIPQGDMYEYFTGTREETFFFAFKDKFTLAHGAMRERYTRVLQRNYSPTFRVETIFIF